MAAAASGERVSAPRAGGPPERPRESSGAQGRTRDGSRGVAAAPSPGLSAQLVGHARKTIFGKDFIVYEIRVQASELAWQVQKRYRDFRQLYDELVVFAEGSRELRRRVPSVPPRKLLGNLDEGFVLQRELELRKFLADVLAVPEFTMSVPVLSFLGALSNRAAEEKEVRTVKQTLHVDQVLPLLDSGDIVLFKTKGLLQSMQRSVLSSEYDHVGLVVRYPIRPRDPNCLYLLEATVEGVRRYRLLSRLRAWHLSEAVLVVRRLLTRRSDEFNRILADFSSDMDGKDYGLNPGAFIRRKDTAVKESFFCSEVVAMAYKRVGLLPADTASNQFFPVTFSESGELQLQGEARLAHEILVSFKNPEVERARRESRAAEDIPADSPRRVYAARGVEGGGGSRSDDDEPAYSSASLPPNVGAVAATAPTR